MSGWSSSQATPSTYAANASRLVKSGMPSSTARRRRMYSSSSICSNFSWVSESGTLRSRSISPRSSASRHVRVPVRLAHLVEDPDAADPTRGKERPGVLGRRDPEAQGAEMLRHGQELFLERRTPDRKERGTATRDQTNPGGDERLHEGVRERRSEAGDLAGRLHLDAEERVRAGKLEERELGNLHAPSTRRERSDPLARDRLPEHRPRGLPEQRDPGRLREERERTARAEVELDDLVRLVLDQELNVERAPDLERAREAARRLEELRLDLGGGMAWR